FSVQTRLLTADYFLDRRYLHRGFSQLLSPFYLNGEEFSDITYDLSEDSKTLIRKKIQELSSPDPAMLAQPKFNFNGETVNPLSIKATKIRLVLRGYDPARLDDADVITADPSKLLGGGFSEIVQLEVKTLKSRFVLENNSYAPGNTLWVQYSLRSGEEIARGEFSDTVSGLLSDMRIKSNQKAAIVRRLTNRRLSLQVRLDLAYRIAAGIINLGFITEQDVIAALLQGAAKGFRTDLNIVLALAKQGVFGEEAIKEVVSRQKAGLDGKLPYEIVEELKKFGILDLRPAANKHIYGVAELPDAAMMAGKTLFQGNKVDTETLNKFLNVLENEIVRGRPSIEGATGRRAEFGTDGALEKAGISKGEEFDLVLKAVMKGIENWFKKNNINLTIQRPDPGLREYWFKLIFSEDGVPGEKIDDLLLRAINTWRNMLNAESAFSKEERAALLGRLRLYKNNQKDLRSLEQDIMRLFELPFRFNFDRGRASKLARNMVDIFARGIEPEMNLKLGLYGDRRSFEQIFKQEHIDDLAAGETKEQRIVIYDQMEAILHGRTDFAVNFNLRDISYGYIKEGLKRAFEILIEKAGYAVLDDVDVEREISPDSWKEAIEKKVVATPDKEKFTKSALVFTIIGFYYQYGYWPDDLEQLLSRLQESTDGKSGADPAQLSQKKVEIVSALRRALLSKDAVPAGEEPGDLSFIPLKAKMEISANLDLGDFAKAERTVLFEIYLAQSAFSDLSSAENTRKWKEYQTLYEKYSAQFAILKSSAADEDVLPGPSSDRMMAAKKLPKGTIDFNGITVRFAVFESVLAALNKDFSDKYIEEFKRDEIWRVLPYRRIHLREFGDLVAQKYNERINSSGLKYADLPAGLDRMANYLKSKRLNAFIESYYEGENVRYAISWEENKYISEGQVVLYLKRYIQNAEIRLLRAKLKGEELAGGKAPIEYGGIKVPPADFERVLSALERDLKGQTLDSGIQGEGASRQLQSYLMLFPELNSLLKYYKAQGKLLGPRFIRKVMANITAALKAKSTGNNHTLKVTKKEISINWVVYSNNYEDGLLESIIKQTVGELKQKFTAAVTAGAKSDSAMLGKSRIIDNIRSSIDARRERYYEGVNILLDDNFLSPLIRQLEDDVIFENVLWGIAGCFLVANGINALDARFVGDNFIQRLNSYAKNKFIYSRKIAVKSIIMELGKFSIALKNGEHYAPLLVNPDIIFSLLRNTTEVEEIESYFTFLIQFASNKEIWEKVGIQTAQAVLTSNKVVSGYLEALKTLNDLVKENKDSDILDVAIFRSALLDGVSSMKALADIMSEENSIIRLRNQDEIFWLKERIDEQDVAGNFIKILSKYLELAKLLSDENTEKEAKDALTPEKVALVLKFGKGAELFDMLNSLVTSVRTKAVRPDSIDLTMKKLFANKDEQLDKTLEEIISEGLANEIYVYIKESDNNYYWDQIFGLISDNFPKVVILGRTALFAHLSLMTMDSRKPTNEKILSKLRQVLSRVTTKTSADSAIFGQTTIESEGKKVYTSELLSILQAIDEDLFEANIVQEPKDGAVEAVSRTLTFGVLSKLVAARGSQPVTKEADGEESLDYSGYVKLIIQKFADYMEVAGLKDVNLVIPEAGKNSEFILTWTGEKDKKGEDFIPKFRRFISNLAFRAKQAEYADSLLHQKVISRALYDLIFFLNRKPLPAIKTVFSREKWLKEKEEPANIDIRVIIKGNHFDVLAMGRPIMESGIFFPGAPNPERVINVILQKLNEYEYMGDQYRLTEQGKADLESKLRELEAAEDQAEIIDREQTGKGQKGDKAGVEPADPAMLSKPVDTETLSTPVGGINLNPKIFDLQIKRDGKGIPLPISEQSLENINIQGFVPIIINITPINNLPLLLGVAETPDKPVDLSRINQLQDYDRQERFVLAKEEKTVIAMCVSG
ncbi:MAG: hypothetical protein HQL27_08460, partial [Candidatus Omnitrophica bacterium]|nr:hypothetical protein [Candidatus Omnitrophota bacterium]